MAERGPVMRLEAIAGQPRAVELLRRALASGRVAHAYAFVGPPGAGRATTALAFAGALLCDRGGCGGCRACQLVAARQHPDLHVFVPTPPPGNARGARAIRISDIRELERRIALRPAMAARRVCLLDEAERMTGEAPEAFLKTLEEPSPGTVLILVLPGVRAVPATVLSRCHVVRFQARGDSGAAAARAEALDLLRDVRAQGFEALFRRAERVDRERAEALVDACWLLLRDLLVLVAGAGGDLLEVTDRADELAVEARSWTVEGLLEAIALCRAAREGLRHNVSPRLTVEAIVGHVARRAA
jgi:DNA polymerase-3 subunit delta'